ncbi:hypothetical protein [Solidesulfovibrio alcoholivorans]|uniref:hypothetical protein n=1 Tax=Solidesulfovibrio alcoholivorans TaxID=81406 RepID=UPI000496A91A|nr:hypothetical protein [Solidesulfovibrio alcoholivorans]
MSSNMFGQIGSMFNMAANGFDPFQKIDFPDTGTFWVSHANKASTLSNPYSGLSYTSPGDYKQMSQWSSWINPNQTYTGQYKDNNYSMDTAQSMYKQPSNGAWDKYQSNLQQPGEIAAKNAYDSAMQAIKGSMGGKGMYGSSVMNQQANDKAYKTYSDALTTNAAQAASQAQQARDSSNQYLASLANNIYGTRTGEWNNLANRETQVGLAQNQFNQSQDQQKLSELAALNSYNLQNANAQNNWNMTQAQNEGNWNWNTNAYDNNLQKSWWDGYYMPQISWDQSERQNLFKNYLTWWDMGNPTEENLMQNKAASYADQRSGDDSIGGLLKGGMGLLGTIGGWGTGGGNTVGGSILKSIFG